MALENLIEKEILTELGIGNVGELCCSDCPDEDGESSTDGAGARCGDVRDDIEDAVLYQSNLLKDYPVSRLTDKFLKEYNIS